jgi:hypothetical protein
MHGDTTWAQTSLLVSLDYSTAWMSSCQQEHSTPKSTSKNDDSSMGCLKVFNDPYSTRMALETYMI